jgi:hypothetical protein
MQGVDRGRFRGRGPAQSGARSRIAELLLAWVSGNDPRLPADLLRDCDLGAHVPRDRLRAARTIVEAGLRPLGESATIAWLERFNGFSHERAIKPQRGASQIS